MSLHTHYKGIFMATNDSLQSEWADLQTPSSKSQNDDQYDYQNYAGRYSGASNDDDYKTISHKNDSYKSDNSIYKSKDLSFAANDLQSERMDSNLYLAQNDSVASTQYQNDSKYVPNKHVPIDYSTNKHKNNYAVKNEQDSHYDNKTYANADRQKPTLQVSERIFMNGLIKHTVIALVIIIPLAAISAYAAPVTTVNTANESSKSPVLSVTPSDIIYKSADTPTTVDKVDLKKYSGKWYEIGRMPLFFQRNCIGNVTATYTGQAGSSDITVLNECSGENSTVISSEGLAMPVDEMGSKLKVTFLPSWIRWLPVGRGDYWVLARDDNYQTALVGTPDKSNLWLLARTPNISQQTYSKYRQIAQQQGYDLKEFTLTPQSNQTVNLVP